MRHDITLRVNNDTYRVAVDSWRTLNEVLREELNLTGTKRGCGTGDSIEIRCGSKKDLMAEWVLGISNRLPGNLNRTQNGTI